MFTVANFDVSFLADHMVQFAKEMLACQSAGQAQFVVHDRTRATSFIEYLRQFTEFLSGTTDPLDLPKTHPGAYQMQDFPVAAEIEKVENLLIKAVIWRFQSGYQELAGSQSKDRSSGLISYDKDRLLSLCDNTISLIKQGETTLDLPEYPGEATTTKTK